MLLDRGGAGQMARVWQTFLGKSHFSLSARAGSCGEQFWLGVSSNPIDYILTPPNNRTAHDRKAHRAMELSLIHVYAVQCLLDDHNVACVITGDLALLYHNVDRVLHVGREGTIECSGKLTGLFQSIEVCVPLSQIHRVREILGSEQNVVPLSDVMEPDFYHPYKRSALQYHFAGVTDTMVLEIVTDAALQLDLTEYSTSADRVMSSLAPWCQASDERTLGALRFPTLPAFINAWLNLAKLAQSTAPGEYSVFMMEAECLMDSNNRIDETWCKAHIRSTYGLRLAMSLLDGQAVRVGQCTWG